MVEPQELGGEFVSCHNVRRQYFLSLSGANRTIGQDSRPRSEMRLPLL